MTFDQRQAQLSLGDDSSRHFKEDVRNADSLASEIAAFGQQRPALSLENAINLDLYTKQHAQPLLTTSSFLYTKRIVNFTFCINL